MAKETKEERIDRLSSVLNERIDNYLGNPQALVDFYKFKQQFHNYSMKNTALIDSQHQGAVQVSSYKKWQDKGYQVKKGEKAIYVFAPSFVKGIFKKIGNQEKLLTFWTKATKDQKSMVNNKDVIIKDVLAGYRTVPVFDLTQTDCPVSEYPDYVKQFYAVGEAENYSKLKTALDHFREEKGVQLLDNQKNYSIGNARGFYSPSDHAIYIKRDLDEKQELKTTIHELAHSQLHRISKLSSPIMEYQAEMTACIVSEYFGLEVIDVSTAYIKSHIGNMEIKEKEQVIEQVINLSNEMVNSIEATLEQEFNLTPDQNKPLYDLIAMSNSPEQEQIIISRQKKLEEMDRDNDGAPDRIDIDDNDSTVQTIQDFDGRENKNISKKASFSILERLDEINQGKKSDEIWFVGRER